jgi:NAD(P)-dependent dehydrogenase (short-subunit alcohol dehydrogenase family)
VRSVLVTGGGSGIGRGIVAVLSGRGWSVLVNDIDAGAAERAAAEAGGQAVPGDVAADAPALLEAALRASGGELHGLVNNAGILRRAELGEVAAEQLDEVYRVNLRAAILLAQAALPHLSRSRGAVVNISSIAGQTPQMHAGLYAASKAGLSQFTRQAAVEWGPRGVRVNAVAPGMVRTAISESVWAVPELYERRRALVPAGRIGTPEDVGRVVAFLLSEDADYVTGQVITVDGGFSQVLIDQIPHPAP